MCAHEDFNAFVEVNRLTDPNTDGIHSFAADVKIECADCGASFGFRCQDVGLLPDRPAVSPDALELRLPLISPTELELLGPLAAMTRPSDHPGFTIRQGGDAGRTQAE